ncbi:MAG: Lipoate-protein ligase [Proteobacteria bacterium]|nr:Lipoate-protein ligase [Pseudomonadota bacterium]
MDLGPFAAINPCGYAGMRVTQCRDLGVMLSLQQAGQALTEALQEAIYS